MGTICLEKGNVKVWVERNRFLKILEVLENQNENLKEVRKRAKKVDKILVKNKKILFLYKETLDYCEATVEIPYDSEVDRVLEAFLMSEVRR